MSSAKVGHLALEIAETSDSKKGGPETRLPDLKLRSRRSERKRAWCCLIQRSAFSRTLLSLPPGYIVWEHGWSCKAFWRRHNPSIRYMKYDSCHTFHFYAELHSGCNFWRDLALEGGELCLLGAKKGAQGKPEAAAQAEDKPKRKEVRHKQLR